jgi:hypothetical protein
MSLNKADAIKQLGNSPSVSNQESLVKKLQGPRINKQVKMVIPGGASLTELVSKEQLPTAIFTWLRRVRHFKDVEISLVDTYAGKDYQTSTVVDFNTATKLPEWEIQGKKWLADQIADVLSMDNVYSVKVEKHGISVVLDKTGTFGPDSDSWEPNVTFTPHKPTGF